MHGIKMYEVNISDLLKIYEKEICKNIKNKKKLINFEVNKIQNINDIKYMLENKDIGHETYNIFLIYEPKCRLVMSLSVKDKIINHYITRYILETKLTKYLDFRNVATRKNMGTDYGIKLLLKYLKKLKNSNFYILKIDISKYFYSIDHDVLKKLLIDKLDSYEFSLLEKIIDSTNTKYINEIIIKLKEKNNIDIPLYHYKNGLPIGNMTSQFLSIFYLYKLDHFIVHDLKLKNYVRYMDDFIIIEKDLQKLKNAKNIIINKLENEYKLQVNKNKTKITNCKVGFSFLGYTYKIINKKSVVKIKKECINKIKKKIKKTKHLLKNKKIDYYKAFCIIMNYSNTHKFCNNNRIIKIINRYFYYEK